MLSKRISENYFQKNSSLRGESHSWASSPGGGGSGPDPPIPLPQWDLLRVEKKRFRDDLFIALYSEPRQHISSYAPWDYLFSAFLRPCCRHVFSDVTFSLMPAAPPAMLDPSTQSAALHSTRRNKSQFQHHMMKHPKSIWGTGDIFHPSFIIIPLHQSSPPIQGSLSLHSPLSRHLNCVYAPPHCLIICSVIV